MELGNMAAGLSRVGFVENDGLRGGASDIHQLPSPLKTFKVESDDLCLRIFDQILQIVDLIEVQLVSHANDFRKTYVGACEEISVGEEDASTLGQDRYFPLADRTPFKFAKRDDKTIVDIHEPDPIGPYDPDSPFPRNLEDLIL